MTIQFLVVSFLAGFLVCHLLGAKISAEFAKLETKLKADFEAIVKDIKEKV